MVATMVKLWLILRLSKFKHICKIPVSLVSPGAAQCAASLTIFINNFNEENFNKLYFVQLLGHAINSNRRKNPLMQEVAEKFHAKSLGLPTPLYILNPKIIPALKKEPYFKVIENCYHNLDLLFTGLGTI